MRLLAKVRFDPAGSFRLQRYLLTRGGPGPSPESGSILVMFLLFLPVLILFVGLVADLGLIFLSRNIAYHAADLGALAGAQDLDLARLSRGEVYIDEMRAVRDARSWTLSNLRSNFSSLDVDSRARVSADVYNASAGNPVTHRLSGRLLRDPTVSVTVTVPVKLHFLSMLWSEVLISARADASVVKKK